MLENGVFLLFPKMALTIFFIFLMVVEENGAHHLRQIAILEDSLRGIN